MSSTEVTVIDSNGDATKFMGGRGFYVQHGILFVTDEEGRTVGAARSWERVAVTTSDPHTSILGRTCQCGSDHWRN